jgi:hypothetical protein
MASDWIKRMLKSRFLLKNKKNKKPKSERKRFIIGMRNSNIFYLFDYQLMVNPLDTSIVGT